MSYGIRLHVWGERACFTRPEMKVERVSYDLITPSAARAVFEAILWKPAIRWHVDRIRVLNAIQFESIRRNEVGSKASSQLAAKASIGPAGNPVVNTTNTNNRIPEIFSGQAPLPLVPGQGAQAGRWVNQAVPGWNIAIFAWPRRRACGSQL